MLITESAPPDWDARATFPLLTHGFAQAAATIGHRALYVTDAGASALVLVRALPLPLVGSWTARAKAYLSCADAGFVRRLNHALAARGIARVRLGDSVLGMPRDVLEGAGLRPHTAHLLEHAPAETDEELFARLAPRRRAALRRAEREGVVVSEVRTEEALARYCALAGATERRAQERGVGAVLPKAYFAAIFRHMVPRKQAVIFLAQRGDEPLAGALFLTSAERMTYFHAASTRARELTTLQGPTAVIWHALRVARARGFSRFDLGAVTPTDTRDHPHHSVYHFKREFGGHPTELTYAEPTFSRLKVAFQDHVMLPVWKRMHGAYMAAFGTSHTAPETAISGTDLRWAGVPRPSAAVIPALAPWDVADVVSEIRSLDVIRPHGVRISETARVKAITFTQALHAAVGRDVPRPNVASSVDGGVAVRWPQAVTGTYFVEVVFLSRGVEYAVVDGEDVTAPEQVLVDGETTDPGIVLREIVKRYVVRS